MIRWADSRDEMVVLGEYITWSGVTTGSYWMHEGVERRLLIEHSLDWYKESGVWQRDVECYVIG